MVVESRVMVGVGIRTVNDAELLDPPEVFTITCAVPGIDEVGTGTTIWVSLQVEGVAGTPLKETVLAPWVAPKFVPETVTTVPTGPEVGDILAMFGGGGMTVKAAEPQIDPVQALMVAEPADTA